jgi:dihydroxyacetone kinase phosphoprotein-dependent L subunit
MDNARAHDAVRLIVQRMVARIEAAEEELGKLDTPAGDGDHGAGMVRGLRGAATALAEADDNENSPGDLLVQAGSAFSDAAGGASGALVGMFIVTIGQTLDDGPFQTANVHAALDAGLAMMRQLGKAKPGDKTMVDTLYPFVKHLEKATNDGLHLATAWQSALPAAEAGARSTSEMISRRGRSSRLGERSRGHLDPGAMSMLYMLQAAGDVLNEVCRPRANFQA